MEKSKLFLLLQQLDSKERQSVADYFCQPYFSQKHPHLQQLLHHLLRHRHRPQAVRRNIVFVYLFGVESCYNDLKMRHLSAEVLSYTEVALANYYAQQSDTLWLPLQILQLYSRKQLPKHYKGMINTLERAMAEHPYRHTDYFLQQYRFFNLQEQFTNDRTDPAKQIALTNASCALDIFYIAQKLRMMAALYTLQQVRQTDSTLSLADTILLVVAQNPHYLRYTVVAAYYYSLQMQTDSANSDNWFAKLKALIHTTDLALPFDEAQEIYFFALNYCAVQINRGHDSYLLQIFDLYQIGLQTKWLLEEGTTLSVFNYKNMTTVALRLQRYDHINGFLHDYRQLLPATQRESAFTYNLANYHFYRREYDLVLPLLQNVSHDEIFYSLDTRLLLLKTYYELEETEALFSLIESTKQLLNRTKQLSRERQQTYRNFLKFVRKLSSLPPKATRKTMVLRQQIEQTTHLADKKWLLLQL